MELYRAAFSDDLQLSLGGINGYDQEASSAAWAGASGGNITGNDQTSTLIGSNFSDSITSSNNGSFIIAGMGNDTINSIVGGGVDIIVDDGGYDSLILDASVSDVNARWSDNGEDLNIYVLDSIEATIIGANTAGALEAISIGGVNYSQSFFINRNNISPISSSNHFDIIGSFTGYIGSAYTTDSDGDQLQYRLVSVSGDFSVESFTVNKTGQIFANFIRDDSGSSQFTHLTIEAFDGIATADVEVTIRWASQGEVNPEFRWMIGSPDTFTETFPVL